MATDKWFYFADGEDVLYCTHDHRAVWQLDDAGQWSRIPATFTQLARFSADLREVTKEEARRIPAPPPPAQGTDSEAVAKTRPKK